MMMFIIHIMSSEIVELSAQLWWCLLFISCLVRLLNFLHDYNDVYYSYHVQWDCRTFCTTMTMFIIHIMYSETVELSARLWWCLLLISCIVRMLNFLHDYDDVYYSSIMSSEIVELSARLWWCLLFISCLVRL